MFLFSFTTFIPVKQREEKKMAKQSWHILLLPSHFDFLICQQTFQHEAYILVKIQPSESAVFSNL